MLSAETVPIQLSPQGFGQTSGALNVQPEVPFSYKGGKHGASWLIGLRVFLDGVYQDPPPEVLPPVPAMGQAQPINLCCCTIL